MDKQWYPDFSHYDIGIVHQNVQKIMRLPESAFSKRVPQQFELMRRFYACKLAIELQSLERPVGEYIDAKEMSERDRETIDGTVELLEDYIWVRTGRPRWFIDNDMVDLLLRTPIDDDLTGVRWPFDVFRLVFERGARLHGLPLRSITVANIRSQLARDIATELGVQEVAVVNAARLVFYLDCGENGRIGGHFDDTPYDSTARWLERRILEHPTSRSESTLNDQEYPVMADAIRIATAAVLYWNARPEFVRDYAVPRSSRQGFKDRDCIRRVYLPLEKTYGTGGRQQSGGGAAKAPHFRGFVLRTLRNERFARNADGSLRVILVEPCAIHPELMTETKKC